MKQGCFWIAIPAIAALLTLEGTLAKATTLKALSLEQLVERADVVVRGRVGKNHCEWRDKLIYTITTISVTEVLVGDTNRRIKAVQLGGVVGKHSMPVAGVAQLTRGEEVVLFLRRNKKQSNEYYLAGMSQGKLSVVGQDQLRWAPTAALWDSGRIQQATPQTLNMKELRQLLRARP